MSNAIPTIQTVQLNVDDQEFSIVLPERTREFTMQPRDSSTVRFAFVTGKVAGPTEPFATMKSGGPFAVERIAGSSVGTITIFFATSSGTSPFVEVVSWQ